MAWASPAVAAPMAAPGTTAFTVKVRHCGGCIHTLLLGLGPQQSCKSLRSQRPRAAAGDGAHPGGERCERARLEVAEAVDERLGVVPKFRAPGSGKVMVWLPLGVTELDGPDATL